MNRFDEFYLTICKEVGGIEGFIESFFEFLSRKTDFFYQSDPGDKMGFPPGYSRQLLMRFYDKYQQLHYKKNPKKSVQEYQKKVQAYKSQIKSKSNEEEIKKQQLTNKQQKIAKQQQNKDKRVAQPIINTYNGGKTQRYSWSQQLREVEVTLEVDPQLTAKQITVDIRADSVKVTTNKGQILLEGKLSERINTSDSLWKIQKSNKKTLLVLNLQKAEQRIWSSVLKGDPQIDTTKVNNSKPLNDFDGETQGAIRKIMYQQQRKQMGLPTTQQQKQHQLLRTAWNAQGSPFKGQPFDPSRLNLSGSDFQPK